MSTFLYTRPSDRHSGTLTVNTGTEDSAYLKENLDDNRPEKPAKLTGTTGSWVRDNASAVRGDICGIFHHNFSAGQTIRVQAHTADSWATPSVNVLVTPVARHLDNFPVNLWVDFKAIYPADANRTYRYWRLLVETANSTATPVSVGEWAVYTTKRDLSVRNIKWGSERSWRRPVIVHETDYLVRRMYDLGTTVRTLAADIDPTDDTLDEVETWFRDAQGVTRPFLIVPHSSETEPWFVVFTSLDQPYTRERLNYNVSRVTFQEMSRGLYPD
jgi:hypothetical protein